MLYLSESQWMLWGGIAVMSASVIGALAGIIIFTVTGRKLKKRLEQEFGKPQ